MPAERLIPSFRRKPESSFIFSLDLLSESASKMGPGFRRDDGRVGGIS
jgi:hypothetical protein